MGPRAADAALTDRDWRGYHPLAMLPAAGAALAGSAALYAARWGFDDVSEFADRVGPLVGFVVAASLWAGLLAAFLYRCVTYTYRLTDRSLLIDFGFLHPPVPPVVLGELKAVESGGGWLRRLLGVGWVEVRTADRAVRLPGVRHPAAFADAIRTAAQAARYVG